MKIYLRKSEKASREEIKRPKKHYFEAKLKPGYAAANESCGENGQAKAATWRNLAAAKAHLAEARQRSAICRLCNSSAAWLTKLSSYLSLASFNASANPESWKPALSAFENRIKERRRSENRKKTKSRRNQAEERRNGGVKAAAKAWKAVGDCASWRR